MGRAGPLLLALLLLAPPPAHPARTRLALGYLTVAKGTLRDRQGLSISGALTMALDEINNDPNLLPDVELVMRWNDTRGETVLATKAITDMICDGVIAFFGPEEYCYIEAIVSQSQNLPMISYKCSDYKASSIPTFARTDPPNLQVTKSIITVLKYYRWQKFSIMYDEKWERVALSLEILAKDCNMTVNHLRTVKDQHECCEESMACCNIDFWYQNIQETKDNTRSSINQNT